MRWEQNIRFRPLRLGEETRVEQPPLSLVFTCYREGNKLTVRYQAAGEKITTGKKSWFFNSHFIFEFDFDHDHRHRSLLAILPDGTIVERIQELSSPTEEPGIHIKKKLAWPEREFISRPGELSVSLAGVRSPVIGFNLSAILGENPAHSVSLIPGADPFTYADLYLEPIPEVQGIRFNYPTWELNRLDIDAAANIGSIKTRFTGPDFEYVQVSEKPNHAPYQLDRRAKWSNDMEQDAMLQIEAGPWRAAFPVSFDHALIARDRIGSDRNAVKPSPEDPDFAHKIEQYYLKRLPNFRRVRDEKGYRLVADDFTIDLLGKRVTEQINQALLQVFPDPADYLCGLSALLGSPAGLLHSEAFGGRASGTLNADSLWLLSRSFCSINAWMFGLMAEMAASHFKTDWKCFYAGLDGHVVAGLRWNNVFHCFDPMMGKFFFALDNRRFATLDEIRELRDVSYRVDCFNRAFGHEFYFEREIQMQKFRPGTEELLFET